MSSLSTFCVTAQRVIERRTGALSREQHVRDLKGPRGARIANLDHDRRVALIFEGAATAHDDAPRLADHLGPSRDGESARDDVRAGIEVDDVATGILPESAFVRHHRACGT